MINPERYAYLNRDFIKFIEHKREREYKLWYDGEINELLQHYKTENVEVMNYTPNFLSLVPTGAMVDLGAYRERNNFTVYHNPIANVVTKAMVDLIFSQAPTISIDTGNKVTSKASEELLDEIIEENNLISMFQEAAELESYSGAVAFKPILDAEFSDYPIVQAYPKERLIINKKYGKVVSLVFKDILISEADPNNGVVSRSFVLLSEYGKGYIKYKLIQESNEKEVPLSTLPETKDLKTTNFIGPDGEPFPHMLAVYKENKAGGRSDYENCIDDFMAIDEIYSNMMNFIRKAKLKVARTENTLKKAEDGVPIVPSEYDTNTTILWDSNPNDLNQATQQQVIDINSSVQGYLSAQEVIEKNIAKTVGLSIKATLGEDGAGANASGDALEIRENMSLKTRDEKVIKWNSALIELVKLVMSLNSPTFIGDTIQVEDKYDWNIAVDFYNPAKPTFAAIVEETEALLNAGLIDDLRAMFRVWVDTDKMTEDEVLEMYEILQSNGIEESKEDIPEPEVEEDNESIDDTNKDIEE